MTVCEISHDEYLAGLQGEVQADGLIEAVRKRLDEINHVALALGYCECGLVQEKSVEILDMLKMQEPRLMDFSDIQTMSKVDVYLEDRGSDLVYPLMLLGAENSNKSQAVFFHPMTVKPLSAYGKTWRCWTCRPSLKQREETPWE